MTMDVPEKGGGEAVNPSAQEKPTDETDELLKWLKADREREQKEEDERRASVVEDIARHPPSFYENGIPKVPSTITSLDMAVEVADLGKWYACKNPDKRGELFTRVVEWNRKKEHYFVLETQLPDAQGNSIPISSRIPLKIAQYLVEEKMILRSSLGYHENEIEVIRDKDTGDYRGTNFTPNDDVEEPLLDYHKGRQPSDYLNYFQ